MKYFEHFFIYIKRFEIILNNMTFFEIYKISWNLSKLHEKIPKILKIVGILFNYVEIKWNIFNIFSIYIKRFEIILNNMKFI